MKNKKTSEAEKPPLFKNWKGWYFLEIGNLVFLIILFYLFTKFFE